MGNAQEIKNPFLTLSDNQNLSITERGASHFAKMALKCMQQEYPNKLNQVLKDKSFLKTPSKLHPAFYGCYDWHSSVHGHWMLVRLLKAFPNLPEGKEIREKLQQNLTSKNIEVELTYLKNASKSWERMYGWAWLLKLAQELNTWEDKDAQQLSENLQPLANAIVDRYLNFLPKQTYPVRTGVHPNTAFGLSFAYDYAQSTHHKDLISIIEKRARDYYLKDKNCPADWEPSGEDFLSPCLEEANLMQRVLNKDEFNNWFQHFLPREKLAIITKPADVSDRSDPKIVHLDGLNLSRAWCMYHIIPHIKSIAVRSLLKKAAAKHLMTTIPNVATKHYVGSHWLASFAVYALSSK
ncbi:MAG TPA: DUF2891 domain-containing protein [Saprospiraceae bacterium]|nr:DUF2891 domain-containing protein [Saprospiraceae bacterium]